MAVRLFKDREWVQQSFFVHTAKIDDVIMRRRLFTSASAKFTDTTLGGNFAMNAPPSYCRFADPRMGGRQGGGSAMVLAGDGNRRILSEEEIPDQLTSTSSGMGAYYSEAIDDNAQLVIMRFGVPAFNSLMQFFGNFYSSEAAQLARSGRATDGIINGTFFKVGQLMGSMLALPFQPIILLGQVYRFLTKSPASKFYYLKESMWAYWGAVQNMVNGIGVNLGIVPGALTEEQSKLAGQEYSNDFGPGGYAYYAKQMPDLISPDGFIDVYAMSTKAQRRANKYNTIIRDGLETVSTIDGVADVISKARKAMATDEGITKPSYKSYTDRFREVSYYKQTPTSNVTASGDISPTADADSASSAQSSQGTDEHEKIGNRSMFDWGNDAYKFWEGNLRDGGDFISIRADYTGSHSESFSNEVGESGIAQKINSASASARSTRFDFADGNIGLGLVEQVTGGIKNFAMGVLDSVHLSGLAALWGNAFVDIPHVWQNSSAQLPSASFSLELRSPYANRFSQMQNIWIPLSMLLAGALPLATGRQSHTSPFICELYCKGRVNIRLGIIDSISVERGVGNVGWSNDGYALGVNVNFSVKDLSTVMSIPITTQFTTAETLLNKVASALPGVEEFAQFITPSMYDDDNVYTDYLATLGSLSFNDLLYTGRRWRLRRAMLQRHIKTATSPARFASWFHGETIFGYLASAIARDTDRYGSNY